MKPYLTEDIKWVHFYPKQSSSFYVNKAGYFDERPEIVTSATQLIVLIALPFLLFQSLWFLSLIPLLLFGWGVLYIHLPIRTGIQDCESASWGWYYHRDSLVFYIGGGGNFSGGSKTKFFYMPWSFNWYRTSTLISDGSWYHETKEARLTGDKYSADPKTVGSYDWIKENRWKESHPYLDMFDNTTVTATIGVEEREWRRRWLMWTTLFNKVSRDIDVQFSAEVGKRKGSWKGGTLGCGWQMKEGEAPVDTLKRMEAERKF